MRIGIDADGVLTDMTAFNVEYGQRFFKRPPLNEGGYSVKEIFGCSEKEEFRYGLYCFITYCKKWPPRPGCREVIELLNRDGHELYEITARKFTTMKNPIGWYSRHLFRRWVRKQGMHFREIYFCSESHSPEDKLTGCQKYAVDLMIDDKPEVAYYLAERGIRVLLYDTPYNQEVQGENIVRVRDWKEIYEYIKYKGETS